MRKNKLVNGEVYHIINKSIAGFRIFNNDSEYSRIIDVIRYYQRKKPPIKFSRYMKTRIEQVHDSDNAPLTDKEKLVEIVAYCIMPTHFHLVLKQLTKEGISTFMNTVLNSYTRYFNTKHKRKGPLWEGRFKSVLVNSDEQLLHLTRYIHLNPVTAYLVDKPEEWSYSSYNEYLLKANDKDRICKYDKILNIEPVSYRGFVVDRASYQRELAKIKGLLID